MIGKILDKLRSFFGRESRNHHAMHSLVALSDSDLVLNTDSLREVLDHIYPGEFLPPREEGNFVVEVIEGAQYFVHSTVEGHEGLFTVHSVPGPYADFSEFLPGLSDHDLRDEACRKETWVGVDHAFDYEPSETPSYRFIATLLARLIDEDSTVLVHPRLEVARRLTQEVKEQLWHGRNPFEAGEEDDVCARGSP